MRKVIILTVFVTTAILFAAGSSVAQSASVAGEWDASMNTPGGARPFKMVLKVDGEKLTGTVKRSDGEYPLTGKIKGADIAFDYTVQLGGNDLTLSYTGKVKGDSISGTVSFGNLVTDPNSEGQAGGSWSAKRTPAAKPKAEGQTQES